MKAYYLLIGLNSKEIKILDVNKRGNGLIEVDIENRKKKKLGVLYVKNLLIQYMIN